MPENRNPPYFTAPGLARTLSQTARNARAGQTASGATAGLDARTARMQGADAGQRDRMIGIDAPGGSA